MNPFWTAFFFSSLAASVGFLALVGLTYLSGGLHHVSEAGMTIRLFGCVAAGVIIGLIFGVLAISDFDKDEPNA